MHTKHILLALILLLSTETAAAAIIHGSVYNTYLEPLENTIIRINTSPPQTRVAHDSTYSFSVNPGKYTITASYSNIEEFFAEENITIDQEGTYTIDLILLPYLEEEEIDSDIEVSGKPPFSFSPVFFLIALIVLVAVLFFVIKHIHHHPASPDHIPTESDEEKAKILKIIKEAGGRITQKDIRKQSPLSEAKISLIIAELEHENKVKKIKRGRGNIIILQK